MKVKYFLPLFLLTVFLFLNLKPVFASSSYVLPYPSFMPGSKLYKISKVFEQIEKYWYFGNFSQFKYNLKMSDKYLIEAKTLFEYNQYLLAVNSLNNSNNYFKNTPIFFEKARLEGKDVKEKNELLKNAALKHIEILTEVKKKIPESFTWQPEKAESTFLDLEKLIEESISIRKRVL